jgi:hypothetical protein
MMIKPLCSLCYFFVIFVVNGFLVYNETEDQSIQAIVEAGLE